MVEVKELEYETPKNKVNNINNVIEEIKICDLVINSENNLDSQNIKYIAKNKKYFHKQLYELEKIIFLQFDHKNISFSFLYNLCSLIEDCPEFINYSYQWKAIEYTNNLHQIYNNEILKIIIAKLIIVLINNYSGFNDFDQNIYDTKIKPIEEENKRIIINNIKYLKNMGLIWDINDIIKKKIDEILIEIIISLFKNNNFKDFEYMYQLLEQMDFEFIDLTEKMRINLLKYLNDENLFKYENNLFDEIKIDFFYFMLKYILKESYYIYQFPFLLKTRKILLDLFKNNKNKLYISHLDKGFRLRYTYVLKTLLDSKYYEKDLEQILKNKNLKKDRKISVQDYYSTKEKDKNENSSFCNTKEKKLINKKRKTFGGNISNILSPGVDNNTYLINKDISNKLNEISKSNKIININKENKLKIKKENRNSRIEIDEEEILQLIKDKIDKCSPNELMRINQRIYQMQFVYPYDKIDLIFNIHFNVKTKEIENVINGNDINIDYIKRE